MKVCSKEEENQAEFAFEEKLLNLDFFFSPKTTACLPLKLPPYHLIISLIQVCRFYGIVKRTAAKNLIVHKKGTHFLLNRFLQRSEIILQRSKIIMTEMQTTRGHTLFVSVLQQHRPWQLQYTLYSLGIHSYGVISKLWRKKKKKWGVELTQLTLFGLTVLTWSL